MQETWVQSLGWADPLDKGKATHSRIVARRIPWTVKSTGSQRVRYDWANEFHFHFAPEPASVRCLTSPLLPNSTSEGTTSCDMVDYPLLFGNFFPLGFLDITVSWFSSYLTVTDLVFCLFIWVFPSWSLILWNSIFLFLLFFVCLVGFLLRIIIIKHLCILPL